MLYAHMLPSRAHLGRPDTFAAAGQTLAPTFAKTLTPAVLDCLAGIELQHGHHGRAEYLAQRAADLREAGR